MATNLHPLAGKPAPAELLIDLSKLERDYYQRKPDLADPTQLVSFGTSGHRGTSFNGTVTEAHILAITQAVCEYRRGQSYTGPLFMGKDTHAASAAAQRTALEVLAANGVETFLQSGDGFTPTPAISRAILVYNRGRKDGFADGLVITPSHNPPSDGGMKYNPPNGGPADTDATDWIQKRANELLKGGNKDVKRVPFASALKASTTHQEDFVLPYVKDLAAVIDMESIRAAGVKIGIDPLGGAAVAYWQPVQEQFGLNITVVNPKVDPTFRFMTVDHDGKIRMDCSSPYAMAGLVQLKDRFDIAFANDTDTDRHGIVCPSSGLMNPNAYLAAAIAYLCKHRPAWRADSAVGKTVVSSGMIDRLAAKIGRTLLEVPVGFKWFSAGLVDGSFAFGGEESAGASFLRRDGAVWTTDKDGLIMGLLAAEICAETGQDPGQFYDAVTADLGTSFYERTDAPATPAQKARLGKLDPDDIKATQLAGEPILARMTRAPGNDQPIGGIKVTAKNGWYAARPSGTENVYKIYAESFLGPDHLARIQREAQTAIDQALNEI